MNTLTITRSVTYSDASTNPLTITVDERGCTVAFLGVEYPTIAWADINNVELLADRFGELQVRVFRTVVDTLATCYHQQQVVRGLVC